MFKQKIKAASLHLLLSAIFITLSIGAVLYFWFPDSLIHVSNFKEISLLIISIDLVLGPLLTFVVFSPQKKSLKFDLGVVAIIQIAAFSYGIFSLYQVHPVYIAFNVDRFTLVRAIDAKPEKAIDNTFKISKLSSPKLVVAKLPTDEQEQSDLLMEVLDGAPDIALRPNLYHPYADNIQDILTKSLDPKLIFKDEESKKKLSVFINTHGKKKEDYAYLPIEGISNDAIWVLNKVNAKPIGIIDIDPWKVVSKN